MEPGRARRREAISRDLAFIQSSLAYPDPQGYQDFVTQLVVNLLDEGNALFRDGEWDQAVKMFSEGLNVSEYAVTEELQIPSALLESLYVNRAAAHHSMGEFDLGVTDCDLALSVCNESHRALYRKALCLKDSGKYREAYEVTTDPRLIRRPDVKVTELAQQLSEALGLKVRRPYISVKGQGLSSRAVSNGNSEVIKVSSRGLSRLTQVSVPPAGNSLNPLSGFAPVRFPSMPQPPVAAIDSLDDLELIGDDLDSLLDSLPDQQSPTEMASSASIVASTVSAPSVLPAPTPQLPPAFFKPVVGVPSCLDSSAAACSVSMSMLDALDDLSTPGLTGEGWSSNAAPLSVGLDVLDGLDSLDEICESPAAESRSTEEQILRELQTDSDQGGPGKLGGAGDPGGPGDPGDLKPAADPLFSLDALDLFPSVDGLGSPQVVSIGGSGLDSLSDFTSPGSSAAPVARSADGNHSKINPAAGAPLFNPLSATHDFLQACSTCFPHTGETVLSYVHRADLVHQCARDVLLCRRRTDPPSDWTRVRPLRSDASFSGPFVLCRDLQNQGDCRFKEKCHFAYNQLEIDVWTEERKGRLDRRLLFEPSAVHLDPKKSIIGLIQDHKGVFMFLCQECFDNKPRIISKRSQEIHTVCSNMDVHHNFDNNKCLAFVVRTHSVTYRKVRPLSAPCRLDLCRQAIRGICPRDDQCLFAHSVAELKTWRIQRDTGIGPEEIVKVSAKYDDQQEQSSRLRGKRVPSGDGNKQKSSSGGSMKSLDMRMKFVCAQCWQGCNVSEHDKTRTHCNARAKHPWLPDRCVLLVKSAGRSKWVQVRPLPSLKHLPLHYDICDQILQRGRCSYLGRCSFAHSPEERHMWTYMKNNNMPHMQQIYDLWLSLTAPSVQSDGEMLTPSDDKNIVMPTDYAEPLSGFHCRLCGRHSNSERQWQQHISTERHKDRVFSCDGEDEALAWSYRFPGTQFRLCPKLDGVCPDGVCPDGVCPDGVCPDGVCPDGVSCDFAHSPEELQEWTDRRDFLRQKLARAREDMLIMPDEFDFGKYNFLLQD